MTILNVWARDLEMWVADDGGMNFVKFTSSVDADWNFLGVLL